MCVKNNKTVTKTSNYSPHYCNTKTLIQNTLAVSWQLPKTPQQLSVNILSTSKDILVTIHHIIAKNVATHKKSILEHLSSVLATTYNSLHINILATIHHTIATMQQHTKNLFQKTFAIVRQPPKTPQQLSINIVATRKDIIVTINHIIAKNLRIILVTIHHTLATDTQHPSNQQRHPRICLSTPQVPLNRTHVSTTPLQQFKITLATAQHTHTKKKSAIAYFRFPYSSVKF